MADRDGDDEEKRQAQERAAAELKETEALLAGFDRPARTPRPAPAAPDFVNYFEKREPRSPPPAAKPPRRAPLPTADRIGRDRETFVIPRNERRIPRWLAWIGVLGAMPLAGGFIAYLAARDAEPTRTGPAPPPSSTPPATSTPAPRSPEPPSRERPAPPDPSLSAPPPPPFPPSSRTPPPPSRDPRVDFIRKL